MARVNSFPHFLAILFYLSIISCCFTSLVKANRELNEDNWRDILEGEWMVEFYAPWCPACNALAPAWKELSSRASSKSLAMKTAAVDVTASPGLSGRFVVTALPTIFHVKDGEFRQYKGPRDADSMLGWVESARWRGAEPLPGWKAPHSMQMTLVAEFFKLSQVLRNVHNMLMETYGLPTWGSYLIFAVATILIGAVLGLVLVCVIDLLYPPRRPGKAFVLAADAPRRPSDLDENRADDDEALINDDLVDDAMPPLDADSASDAEKHSPGDSSDSETAGGGDSKPAEGAAKPEVRKRRPRMAD